MRVASRLAPLLRRGHDHVDATVRGLRRRLGDEFV
jgi:hypothetical protein